LNTYLREKIPCHHAGDRIHARSKLRIADMNEIPDTAWNATGLQGRNLSGGSFAEEVGSQPTLLVFLRHLG